MRIPVIVAKAIAVAFLVTGILGAAMAQPADPIEAIKARMEAYRSAWNTHDENAVAAFYTEDAVFVIGNLPALTGRQAIAASWRKYFDRQEPERHISIAIDSIRPVTADTAVANITTTTGGRDAAGKELLSRKARGTWLLHRRDDGWFIAALYAMPTEDDDVVLNPSVDAAKALTPRIRAFVDAYEDAFNSHDAAAVSAFYTDDADIIVRNGPRAHGRQAIENWWRAYFSEPRPYRAILIVDEIRMIAPDVALIDLTATGAAEDDTGTESPVRYTRAAWAAVRNAGEWRIAALRVLPSEDDRIIRASDR